MKEFQIFQVLPECDAETQSEQMLLLANGANRLAQHRVATALTCKKQNKKKKTHNIYKAP